MFTSTSVSLIEYVNLELGVSLAGVCRGAASSDAFRQLFSSSNSTPSRTGVTRNKLRL